MKILFTARWSRSFTMAPLQEGNAIGNNGVIFGKRLASDHQGFGEAGSLAAAKSCESNCALPKPSKLCAISAMIIGKDLALDEEGFGNSLLCSLHTAVVQFAHFPNRAKIAAI